MKLSPTSESESPIVSVISLPSSPYDPVPQHLTFPSEFIAQE